MVLAGKGKGFGHGHDLQAAQLRELASRKMPEAIEDEYGVLACIFGSASPEQTFLKVASTLKAEHFVSPDLRDVWKGVCDAYHKYRLPIEIRTIENYLHDYCGKTGEFTKALLSKLFESSYHDPEYVAGYAERIVAKYEKRELAKILANSISLALDPSVTSSDVLMAAESTLRNFRQKGMPKKKRGGSVRDIGRKMLDQIKAIAMGEAQTNAVRTADWYDFNQAAGGFIPGEIVVFGAPPSGGKSTLAVALAKQLAEAGNFTLLVSMEMTEEQCQAKIWGAELKISAGVISKNPVFSLADVERLEKVYEQKMYDLPLHIIQPTEPTVAGVHQAIAEAESEFRERYGEQFTGFRCIVLDYLQYFGEFCPNEMKSSVISSATAQLGHIAKGMGATLFSFAQYSTDVVKSGKKPEGIFCFADSNGISKHADQIIALWSEGYANRQTIHDYKVLEFNWLKNREGGNAQIRMGIDWSSGWLYPLASASNYSYPDDPASTAKRIPEQTTASWDGFEKYQDKEGDSPEEELAPLPTHPDLELVEIKEDKLSPVISDLPLPSFIDVAVVPEVVEPPVVAEATIEPEVADVPSEEAPANGFVIGQAYLFNPLKGCQLKVELIEIDEEDRELYSVRALENIVHGDGKLFQVGNIYLAHPKALQQLE
jgi:replicative DNA helicase